MLSQHVNSLRYRAGLTDPAWITDDKDGWFLQSGTSGLSAEGLSDAGNVMVGWARADRLTGGNLSDLLLGDVGDDVLVGGGGADTLVGGPDRDTLDGGDDAAPDLLLGGSGVDTYVLRPGDTIRDPDRTGIARDKDGRLIAGAFEKRGAQYVWVSDPNVTATKNSPLTINLPGGGSAVIEDAKDGGFGIDFIDVAADPTPTLTRAGDLELVDGDPATEGIQPVPDPQIPENSLRNPGVESPDRADTFYGRDIDAEGDQIDTRGGDDTVYARRGADWVIAGAGRDRVWADQGDDLVEAGPDADIVSGGTGKDRLYADSRVDLVAAIAAGAGVGTGQRGDWLAGGAGDDIVIGGAGNDALFGGDGEDLLIGGAGDDVLNGDVDFLATSFDWTITPDAPPLFDAVYAPVDVLTPWPYAGGADTIYAGAGNDFASGLFGDDVIYGEAGEDVLSGDEGNDTLIGGADNDRITGDYGALVYYSTDQAVVQGDDFLDGGLGDDWLQGEGGADLVFGGEGSDQLYGDAGYLPVAQHGADYLDGGAAVDYLFGQGGDDTLLGGTDGDFLWGDAGADVLDGGAGADYLEGGSEADTLYGGTEGDTLFGNAGEDYLDGGTGDDVLNAGDEADTLIGGPGADTLIGGAGDDTYFANLAEGDRIIDDQGNSLIRIDDAVSSTALIASSAVVDGQSGILLKNDAAATTGLFVLGGLTLLEASNPTFEFADGTEITHAALMQTAFTEALTLTGTSVGDALKGYAGADLIQGLAGDDWLSGGAADDVIEGDEGDDQLIGGNGADTLRGGLGNDTYTVDAEDTVEEFPEGGTDKVLADSSYTLGADLENLTLTGEAAIDATGNTLHNTLTGNDAANVLTGLGGADVLFGGGGADTLEGGLDDDALAGGAGDDEYLLSVGDGADTIDDASGLNAIRFGTGIDASSLTIGQFVGDDGASYLRIGYGPGSDAVAIRRGLLGGIGEYRFADGAVRTHEDILASLGALAVQGTGANDTIVGGANADILDGAAGADQLFGREADDLLRGGDGDDVLWGEAGNDVLDGGPGADILTGGAEEDTYLVTWDMGEDTIVEDPGGLNRLRLGTAVAFEDLVADRIDDDLVLSLRGGSNRLTLAGYYAAAQDWLVTDAASETRTLATVIAQSPAGPPDPIEAEIAAYKARVLREFYSTQHYSVLGDGALERSFSRVTGSESNSTHSTYLLQDVIQASDDGYIGRGSPSVDEQVETTVTESTMTVYVTQPGSRAVAGGLATHGAANDVNWRFVPIGDFSGRVQIPGEAIFIRSATPSPDGSNDIVGLWIPEPGSGGSTVSVPTLSVPVAQTVTITNYFTEQTVTLNLEEIRAGEGDNTIQTTDYSVVDGGAGNDFISIAGAPDYVLPDGPGNRGRIGSLLYGNDGDDSITGGYGNDVLIGGAGFDQLYGGSGADTYLAAGDGYDTIADSGEDLDRYRATYYTVEHFPDLWLREREGGRYYDAIAAEFYRVDGVIPWGNPDVSVPFYDSPEIGLANTLDGLQSGIGSLRGDAAALLRSGALTDDLGRTAGDIAREIRSLEARIGIEQARGLAHFVYVEPLPPLPAIAGNDYAGIEPYYGDTVWVDTVVLDEGWSFSNLMVSTAVFDGEAEALYLERPDGAGVSITLARAADPIGTGVERFEFADGTSYTIRQILDLENQDRTITGTAGDDALTGGHGDDTLVGLAGADYLYGRAGGDSLQGGAGSDYYDYDAGADLIEDLDPTGSDFDGVYLIGITPDAVTTTFDSGYLRLEFTAADSLSIRWDRSAGYGVEEVAFDDGTIWDQAMLESLAAPPLAIITGTGGADTLTGTGGRDEISGLGGNDVLLGLAGPDRLDGGSGADQMEGGASDDTYVVHDAGDQVLENPDEGFDTVEASISFTLPAELEDLTLTGGATLTGTGNALANVLTGNNAANTLDGGEGADTLAGGPGADTLLGDAGDDTFLVAGDEGPDTFDGGEGFDTVLGRAGDDVIRVAGLSAANRVERIDGGDGVNTIAGTAGNNTLDLSGIEVLNVALIDGGAGSDTITGASGDDTIQGGAGADTLAGGAGDDTFLVAGDEGPDAFDGGSGFDTVLGRSGDDVIRVASLSAANTIERIDGGGGTNTIAGTAGNNTMDLSAIEVLNVALIDGGAGNDTITGTAGVDTIQGGAGSDTLTGGAGDDVFLLTGDEGPDTFDGGSGFDTVQGSAGDDVIRVSGFGPANGVERIDGGGGVNAIAGTAGNNTIDLSAVEVLNVALIDGGAGSDTITGTASNDQIQGGAGSDTLFGGAGDDTFLVTGDEGPDTFDGGAGFDTVLGGAEDDVIRFASFTPANTVERIDGGDGVNMIAGTAGNNTIDLSATQLVAIALIDAGAGSDTITGSSGNDTIQGGTGADTLRGGGGDDTFLIVGTDSAVDTVGGDAGFDAILGSAADDTFRFSSYGGANAVERIDGGGGVDTIAGTAGNNTIDLSTTELLAIGRIDAGAGNDTVMGSVAADFITGGDGTDTLRGESGNDLVQGGQGNDTLVETAGANFLDGGAGTDAITGGAGAEFIAGGSGNDTVNPGAGADVLAFNTGDGQDTVNPGSGTNKTLSLGGGIRYEDLALRKSANDLVLETAATESLTLKNWYAASANQGFVTLQMVAEAMAGFSQSSPDPLRDDKVETFSFAALASAFDAARIADPTITRWTLMNALLDAHLAGSDDAALGGDLAYQYGMNGNLAGIATGAAQDVLGSPQFGTQAQSLRPLATLQEGPVKLG